MRLAVIGGGWAGLAAAVEATQRGHAVTLFEMAAQLGGRARGVVLASGEVDNGQHILIGAYTDTLRLLRLVGVDTPSALLRLPLRITHPEGDGLRLPPGAPMLAFVRGVFGLRAWPWRDRLALLRAAAGWSLAGFACAPSLTVAALTRSLPATVRAELIDVLCVAALNTPAEEASAQVFLRVLKDALFSGPGSADLLLPRLSLSAAFPLPAARWLEQHGASLRCAHRVEHLVADGARWSVDNQAFDGVVLATPPGEAARLVQTIAPQWSACASALRYEPIVTVYLQCAGARLPAPMLALRADTHAPAQFVFDRGQLGGPAGLLAFVVSGAQPWVDQGSDAVLQATLQQAHAALGAFLPGPVEPVKVLTERRATFRCTPGLQRPLARIAPQLHAAGDHVEGPYPATLEGAVRSAVAAVAAFG
jgi:hydroxysqualene dehydroxylase